MLAWICTLTIQGMIIENRLLVVLIRFRNSNGTCNHRSIGCVLAAFPEADVQQHTKSLALFVRL